ncbi:MAG: PDZ domain-containing protein [Bradyrhizobiaceae bacterium]|nr:MAG: PDZ domain-containing protein [Bradyrhizobiaceae bacterium]
MILPSELKPPPASVGLELTVKDGALTVVRPLPGGPGDKAGIRAGDVLTAIDGRRTAGLPLAEAVGLLRGASGTDLALGIARPGASAPLTFRPVRGPVQAPPSLSWETQGRVAVVRIGAVSSTTQAGLRAALDGAATRAEAPLEGLVLDLRGNAGGLLDVAEQIGGMLLPAGTEIAKLSGRTPNNARRLVSGQGDVTSGQPIVVIVDARTAAGAEIVAAALQEHGRALVVGQKTAGAGTIQTLLPLPGGQGGLLLTTARIYSPKGTALDGAGVTPDLVLDPQIGLLPSRSGTGAKPDDETTKQIAAAISVTPDGTDRARLAAIKLIESAHKPARPQKP